MAIRFIFPIDVRTLQNGIIKFSFTIDTMA